jgi:hypothetical protein
MHTDTPSQTGLEVSAPIELLKYVRHDPNCDALQPMWHQGPCDCGLSALLQVQPTWVKSKLGPGAVICTTCGDTKTLEQSNGVITCPNCPEAKP